jgi:hypothetical protein
VNCASTFHRVVGAVTLLAFFVACTSSIPVPKSDAIAQKEFYQHHTRVRMKDGEELLAGRMVVNDSTITFYSLLQDGKPFDQQQPLVVRLDEVNSIEQIQHDRGKTITMLVLVSVPIIVVVLLLTLTPTSDTY